MSINLKKGGSLNLTKKQVDEKNKKELDIDRLEVEMGGLRNKIIEKKNDLKKYNLNLEAISLNRNIDIQISKIKTDLSVENYSKDETIKKIERVQTDLRINAESIVTKNKLIDFDENGNRIIYKNSDFLLQKWNNIIINYSGGVLDIFLNGELVKSDIGVVPYMTYDNLTIGEDNGIKGGICNVIYFKRALNSSNIYYLYNMVKDRSPPVLNDSNTTITKQDINKIGTSAQSII
jgi:hypothetical protein